MNILYYHSVCPKSRFVRMLLTEFNIKFELKIEDYWLERENFLKINPSGELPVLVIKDEAGKNHILTGMYAITEYIFASNLDNFLLEKSPLIAAETRKIIDWCNTKLYLEVTQPLIKEKIICFYKKENSPDSQVIRNAKYNLAYHLEYLTYLLTQQDWVSGSKISAADLIFAANISILDYLGDITWQNYQVVKSWYMLVKSRPSFRLILQDKITGFSPSKFYESLDF